MKALLAIPILGLALLYCSVQVLAQQPQGPPNGGKFVFTPTPQQSVALKLSLAQERAGGADLDTGGYVAAEANFRNSITSIESVPYYTPSSAQYDGLAQALVGLGKVKDAMLIYKEHLDANNHTGDSIPAWLRYGVLLNQAGQWKEALAAFNLALPDVLNGDVLRATCHFDADVPQPTSLAAALHMAIGLEANWYGDANGNFRNDRALIEYKRALQLLPNSDLTIYYYGYGLQRLGRISEAKAAFQKASDLSEDDVSDDDVKAAADKELKN